VLLRVALVKDNQQGNAGQQDEEGHQEMAVRHDTFGRFHEAHAWISFLKIIESAVT
jgi:hypothetical protein